MRQRTFEPTSTAWGSLLYHMLVGRPPFELSETGIAALLYKHVQEPPPPPRLFNPSVSADVEQVILHALEKEPAQRFQTIDEMMRALNLSLGRKTNIRSLISLNTPRRLKQLPHYGSVTLRRAAIAVGLMLALTILALVVVNSRSVPADVPVRMTAGAAGTLADVTPDSSEIAAAQARLVSQGFIAYLACTLDNVTQATRAREMGDMATSFGMAYHVYNANNDANTQILQIDQARAEGARAVILCPLDPDLLDESINTLRANNIPLVYTTVFDHPYGVKLDSSSYDIGLIVGRLAGQTFQAERTDTPMVAMLTREGLPASDSRAEGMAAGFREILPRATFLGRFPGFSEEDGYETVHTLIENGMSFNVILALNDVSAYGAIQALQDANFDPSSVIIVSANGESYAQQLIRDGQFLRGTVAINREEASQIAVDAIVKLLAGSEVPETVSYPPGEIFTRDVLLARGG
ncbi:MAG: substrate-binding domain-containing protein [Anaerolineae bacterium]